MRIELRSNIVTQFTSQLTQVENSISQTIDAMKRQRNDVDNVNGGHNNATRNASNSLALRINQEIQKRQKVVYIEKQASAFFNDTVAIDKSVASIMKSNQKQFFNQYSWLKPGIDISGMIEDSKRWLRNTWNSAKEKIAKAWNAICDWVSEHKLVIGTIGLIVGIVCAVLLAPVTLTGILVAVGKVLLSVGISVVISATIEGIFAAITGDDVQEAIKSGAEDGYMFGGISLGISNLLKYIKYLKFPTNVTKYSEEALLSLKSDNADKRAIDHIFKGEVRKGRANGYHYYGVQGVSGEIIRGTEVRFQNGIYCAKVRINGLTKSQWSTFFPDSMNPMEVWDACNEGFINRVNIDKIIIKNTHQFRKNVVFGRYKDMIIRFHLTPDGKFFDAFPFHLDSQANTVYDYLKYKILK